MSATQSAHYIVDESGQMNDWKTWGMGNNNARMIGRRPEVVPGVEPGRWRVVRSRVSRYGLRWYAERRGCHGIVSFPTWREAQDYADRMARTREVVLPRVAPQGEVSVSATWYCDQGAIHYINSAGQVEQGTPADLRPLALALLALAEQEKP